MLKIFLLTFLPIIYCLGNEDTKVSNKIKIMASSNTTQVMQFGAGKMKNVSGLDANGEFTIQRGKCSYKVRENLKNNFLGWKCY